VVLLKGLLPTWPPSVEPAGDARLQLRLMAKEAESTAVADMAVAEMYKVGGKLRDMSSSA